MSRQADLTEASSTQPWPAEWIERWAIERLIPYADNARLHSEADIDKLAHSLRRWGCTNLVRAPRDQASGQSFDEEAARQNHAPGTGHGESSPCCE
jgi:hypothetical protein